MTTDIWHWDDETASIADLPAVGAYNYARHPSTRVWCIALAANDDEPEIWVPGMSPPAAFVRHVKRGGAVWGHNVISFEGEINQCILMRDHGFPAIRNEQYFCTMCLAYRLGLPGALEKLAPAIGIDDRKDMIGKSTMLKLSAPIEFPKRKGESNYVCCACGGEGIANWGQECYRCFGTGKYTRWYEPEEYPEDHAILHSYCKQDLRVEREAGKRLVAMTPKERKIYVLDAEINTRGVQMDLAAAQVANEIVGIETERLNKQLFELTRGEVRGLNCHAKFKRFLISEGVDVEKLAKEDVSEYLARPGLSKLARQCLEIRKEGARASLAKLKAMLRRVSDDCRLRWLLQYHAAFTSRWGGRVVQPQNIPRPKLTQEQIDHVFSILASGQKYSQIIEEIELWYGDVLEVLVDCLRGFLTAREGYELINADLKAAEACMLAWQCHEEAILDIFRGDGRIYEYWAGILYNVPAYEILKEDPRRQDGKIVELACGYQGGVRAILGFARKNGVKGITEEKAAWMRDMYREARPNTVRFWADMEYAAVNAVLDPGTVYPTSLLGAGREIRFMREGSFLWCRLASGYKIAYAYPEIRNLPTPWGKPKDTLTYMSVKTDNHQAAVHDDEVVDSAPQIPGAWTRVKTHGGKLTENVTQAQATGSFLRDSMLRVDARGWPIVLTNHDAITCEVPRGCVDLEEFCNVVAEVPTWAAGMPMKADGWIGDRYRK